MISYYTGLRPGEVELLRMTWEQINLTEKLIIIKSAKKHGLKKREVPILDVFFFGVVWQVVPRRYEKRENSC